MDFSVVNILSSDEPLLLMEASDQIIAQAKIAGMRDRCIVDVGDKFSWREVQANSGSLSLFSEIKLTDIRFTKAPNQEAQKALIELTKTANEESLLLIRLPKLDKKQKNAKWFKTISINATLQELWAPKRSDFFRWIQQRASAAALNLSSEACQMLAERSEGNLLAAKQNIDKLKLFYPETLVDLDKIKLVISDSARYSVFLCIDEALSGCGERSVKMLEKFKQEAVAPLSIVSNLTREIAFCTKVALADVRGQRPMQALAKTYLWENKKKLIIAAANRLPLTTWQKLVVRCAYLDRLVKGQEQGNIWHEIELCLWMVSGQRIWGRRR